MVLRMEAYPQGSHRTIIRGLRKNVLRPIGTTLLPTLTRPEIEMDEPRA